MLSGAKRNRNISDFSGRLGFLASLGMTLGICEIFNAQALMGSRDSRGKAGEAGEAEGGGGRD